MSITPEDDSSESQQLALLLREHALIAEFNCLVKACLSGIYIVPKADYYDWSGVIFVRHGFYQGGIFRFNILIPHTFPDSEEPPRIIFEESICHPQISSDTCQLDTKLAFTPWNKNSHRIHQMLSYMQRAFYRLDLEEAVNSRAAKLFESNPEEFQRRVKESIRKSREIVYDPPASQDSNTLRFSPWDPVEHEKIRAKILHRGDSSRISGEDLGFTQNAQSSGLSWIDPTNFSIVSLEKSRRNPALLDNV